jgi:hypothetical protein
MRGRSIRSEGASIVNPRAFTVGTLLVASATVLPVEALVGCTASSGPGTAALVELYTSEGCSSCPPADRQLSGLRQALDPAAVVVPLALHVGYWDYIGWKDPYAQDGFAERQSWLTQRNHQSVVYTPHFFVSGSEVRTWQGNLRDEVRRLNARPAEAQIRIEASPVSGDSLTLSADATVHNATDRAALYLAVTENGLVSKVTRGENGGATLSHDHVVRAWIGPIPLTGGKVSVHRDIALPASWNRAQLEIVGFVEDEKSGKVLQAVGAQQCFRS